MRRRRLFSQVEFERRRSYVIQGVPVFIASAEDILIAKLEWAKAGESERQIEDAAGVLSAQGASLDRAYVERWVSELGLWPQWQRTLEKSR